MHGEICGGVRFVLTEYRSDLLQMLELGVASWKSPYVPCALCHATGKQLYIGAKKVAKIPKRTAAEYATAALEATKVVEVNAPQLNLILEHLQCNYKWRGHALLRPKLDEVAARRKWEAIKSLGLRHGDVLEPTLERPDPATVRTEAPQRTTRLQFFRTSKRSILKSRTPFATLAGFSVPDTVRLDVLHIVDLGVGARRGGETVLA